jgi:hypothetical protein
MTVKFSPYAVVYLTVMNEDRHALREVRSAAAGSARA